jgi:anthranilate synthase component 1
MKQSKVWRGEPQMTSYDLSAFLDDTCHYQTIPFVQRFFVDTITPIQIFQNMNDEAAFILESKDEASPWSRYSFIGLNPFQYLEEEKGVFLVKDEAKRLVRKEMTFQAAFDSIIKQLNIKKADVDLPFWGGAVGYIGYDAISTIEKVEEPKYNDLNMHRYLFLFCETIIAFDHVKKELIVIHLVRLDGSEDDSKKESIYFQAEKYMKSLFKNMMKSDSKSEMLRPLDMDVDVSFENVHSNYSRERFYEDVEKIKDYIRAGDIFQGVLSQRFERKVSISGFELYRVLRMVNPSPYLFYIKLDDCELIGSSPERLIQIENGHLEIHPIAGTRRRGRTKEEDIALGEELLADEKERAEHYMLVDLARNDIGRVAKYGSVNTPVLMELGRFSHVMHLISKVTGRIREDIHPIHALLSAFPAGTVSGAPKIRAMQILQELEPTARNAYAGTVAYLGFDGNIDSCIAIRTILLKNETAYVQAGAGVVADSKPELEYKETRNKASALIKAIALAEKLFAKGERKHA